MLVSLALALASSLVSSTPLLVLTIKSINIQVSCSNLYPFHLYCFMLVLEELASATETYTRVVFFLFNDRSLLVDSSRRDGIIVKYIAEQCQTNYN